MSYAEAVADNKNLSTEHPLLEGGWSSGESETESSSGNNEENDNATVLLLSFLCFDLSINGLFSVTLESCHH